MTLLIAGHETTAAVLTWTVYCLSQHPQYLRRLQEEVRSQWPPLMISLRFGPGIHCECRCEDETRLHDVMVEHTG